MSLYVGYGIILPSHHIISNNLDLHIFRNKDMTFVTLHGKYFKISTDEASMIKEGNIESLSDNNQELQELFSEKTVSLYFIPYQSLRACTFNLGYNVQLNQVKGSEADFVKLCQETYASTKGFAKDPKGKPFSQCSYKAIEYLAENNFTLMALQEFAGEYETDFLNLLRNLSNNYNYRILGDRNLRIIYDSEKLGLGELIASTEYEVGRPINIVRFSERDIIVINLHAPHNIDIQKRTQEILQKIKLPQTSRILIMGDFNDENGSLSSITLQDKVCKAHGTSPISCCYDVGFSLPGDYILDSNTMEAEYKLGDTTILKSDHYPVILFD